MANMRSSLKPLAGKRARFTAEFSGISKDGHVILSDVRGPCGWEPHLWIPFAKWGGRLLFPGTEFVFSAQVKQYFHTDDNSYDFGLSAIADIEEV